MVQTTQKYAVLSGLMVKNPSIKPFYPACSMQKGPSIVRAVFHIVCSGKIKHLCNIGAQNRWHEKRGAF
jgi:hypothetical protein